MTARIRAALVLAVLASAASAAVASAETPLGTVRIAQGLSRPLFVTSPPGDTARLFIVEQRGSDNRGRVKIVKNGVLLTRPFLTTAVLASGSEQGLLGLAFAPDYATTGRFYINYTRSSDGATIVERRTVSADPDSANPTGTTILQLSQPFANHNGGWLGFGPDGYLYVALGDGGSGGDPGDRAQNLNVLYGKILRLDVSGATYASPPTNPFFGAVEGRDEIWAYGLRNPWRPSFDRLTGDLIIADVGQNVIEEVNFQPFSSPGGENYGWRCFEGSAFFAESDSTPCDSCYAPACPKIFPRHEYTHSSGCSVTGGYVYRGCAIPDLRGVYFFADYCAGTIWSGTFEGDTLTNFRNRTAELAPGGGLAIGTITSFGEDARGELYLCDAGGEVFRIVADAPVAEADMPVLRRQTATGDSLGATTPGNVLMPGVTPFADAGSRLRGIGYLRNAAIRDCAGAPPGCMESRLRLGPFDVDLQSCVDFAASRLTRRFVFTNRSGSPQILAYVDAVMPRVNGDEDGAVVATPAGSGQSAALVLYDSFQPSRYFRHRGSGSAGVLYGADVDTASQLAARIASDAPLAGGASAGPAAVGLALSFDFGSVAPAASETVTVHTEILVEAPSGVLVEPVPLPARASFRVGPVPFRSDLGIDLALPRGEQVTLEVFDVRGRLVRRLMRGALSAGPHRLVWDGRTAGGGDAPAGIYFVRYRDGSATAVRRAVRLR